MTTEYTVKLEQVFSGPMDLLLHLVREQEVDIHEIEIALIVEGYLAYLEHLQDLDIELAGEFAVMSATLMAFKTRSLLPKEDLDLDEDLDPRDELIERLIEYRRFKVASETLEDFAHERERMHERGFKGELEISDEQPTYDLGELTIWDLWSTYSRLQRETAQDRPHRVIEEGRPLRFFVERTVDVMRSKSRTTLFEVVETVNEGDHLDALVGSFCALLELVKIGAVTVEQDSVSSDITIALKDEELDVDALVAQSGFDDEIDPEQDDAGTEPVENGAAPLFDGDGDDANALAEAPADDSTDEAVEATENDEAQPEANGVHEPAADAVDDAAETRSAD